MAKKKEKLDVAIITIKKEEFQAVLSAFPKGPVNHGRNVSTTRISAYDYEIGVVRTLGPGLADAQDLTENLLKDYDVKWIFVVGICGAFPGSDNTLGDIHISASIVDFSVSAMIEGMGAEYKISTYPLHRDAISLVEQIPAIAENLSWSSKLRKLRPNEEFIAANAYGAKDWQSKVKKSIEKLAAQKVPVVSPATTASSNVLVKDAKIAAKWKQVSRDVASIEMELAGVARRVHMSRKRCRVLGIRSVSDIVGYIRSDDWTSYACNAAAEFVANLLKSHRLPACPAPLSVRTPQLLEVLESNRGQLSDSIELQPEVVFDRPTSGKIRILSKKAQQIFRDALDRRKCIDVGKHPIGDGINSSLFWLRSTDLLNDIAGYKKDDLISECLDYFKQESSIYKPGSCAAIGIDVIGSIIAGLIGPSLGLPVICTARDGEFGEAEIFRRVDFSLIAEYIEEVDSEFTFLIITDVLRTGRTVFEVWNQIESAMSELISRRFKYHVFTIASNSDLNALVKNLEPFEKVLACTDSINFFVVPNSSIPI